MPRILLVLGAACLMTACGSTNFNAFITTQEQKDALDQLMIRAQYEFDQGNNDEALDLTSEALKINPYEEKTLVLRAYTYLSKAGLDGFSLSKNLIKQSEDTTAGAEESGDATADNLDSLASIIGLSESDFDLLGTKDETTGTKIYLPKSRSEARLTASTIIQNINLAVNTLCPIIQPGLSKNSDNDTRHTCVASPLPIQGRAQSHFAWALAHLGEAIAFYSVVLYDDKKVDGTGKALGTNIQRVSAGLDQTNVSKFLTDLTALTNAINKIFPTGTAEAADSMLNAMFNDLKVTSLAFGEMGGVPESVTKSIDASIKNLDAKISKVSTTTDSSATSDTAKQNAAIRNALTTVVAADLDNKIEKLSGAEKIQACALFKSINSDPTLKPTGC